MNYRSSSSTHPLELVNELYFLSAFFWAAQLENQINWKWEIFWMIAERKKVATNTASTTMRIENLLPTRAMTRASALKSPIIVAFKTFMIASVLQHLTMRHHWRADIRKKHISSELSSRRKAIWTVGNHIDSDSSMKSKLNVMIHPEVWRAFS